MYLNIHGSSRIALTSFSLSNYDGGGDEADGAASMCVTSDVTLFVRKMEKLVNNIEVQYHYTRRRERGGETKRSHAQN